MRSRYDEGASEDLDEPVTLTERQLRSLKRGATFGMLAVLLALCALAMAAWSLPETRSLISGKTTESGTEQAAVPSSAVPSTPAPEVTPSAPASAPPAQPAAEAQPPAESKPVAAAAPSPKPVSHAVQTRASVTRKVRSKTTEAAFTSTPTPEPFSMETSKPVEPAKPVETPKPVEAPKPVAQDSSISLPAPPSGK